MAAPGGASSLTCGRCGAARAPEHIYCGACGVRLPAVSPAPATAPPSTTGASPPSTASPPAAPYPADTRPGRERADALPYYISPNRIVLLTILTTGLYAFYWLYLTWRQYRDDANVVAYPVWHALTLLLLIYNVFRFHAHMRAYQELMTERGVPNTLNPFRDAMLLVAILVLVLAAVRIAPTATESTPFQQIAYFALSALRVGIMAWILGQAQPNLNRYWQNRLGTRLATQRFTLVELGLVILGLINWVGWTIVLIDPTIIQLPETIAPPPPPQ